VQNALGAFKQKVFGHYVKFISNELKKHCKTHTHTQHQLLWTAELEDFIISIFLLLIGDFLI